MNKIDVFQRILFRRMISDIFLHGRCCAAVSYLRLAILDEGKQYSSNVITRD